MDRVTNEGEVLKILQHAHCTADRISSGMSLVSPLPVCSPQAHVNHPEQTRSTEMHRRLFPFVRSRRRVRWGQHSRAYLVESSVAEARYEAFQRFLVIRQIKGPRGLEYLRGEVEVAEGGHVTTYQVSERDRSSLSVLKLANVAKRLQDFTFSISFLSWKLTNAHAGRHKLRDETTDAFPRRTRHHTG